MTRLRPGIVPLVLATAALACSVPPALPTSAPTRPTYYPSATPTQATTPTPPIRPDWVRYPSAALRISLAYPPGWEADPVNDHMLYLQESSGDGWMQLVLLDATTENLFGLAYSPGMTGEAVLGALLTPAHQDGAFGDPQQITARGGTAWFAEGHDDPHNEHTLIAVLALADRAVVAVGHGGEIAEDWTRLEPIYRDIVASLSAR